MAVSSTEAVKEGMKGRGLTLMHCYADLLWALGPKHYPAPNAGFKTAKILPINISNSDTTSSSNGVSVPAVDDGSNGALTDGEAHDTASHGNGFIAEDSTASTNADGGIDTNAVEKAATEFATFNLVKTTSSSSSSACCLTSPGSINIDPLIEAAVLGGLKSVTNAELPLQLGDFYQKHMLPLKPENITFDFKASKKYKKLSKLLDVFEKQKVLVQKQIRKQDHLFSIDRTHPLIVQWKGMPTIPVDGTRTTTSAAVGSSATARAPTTAPRKGGVHVEYLYKPPTSLRPLFIDTTATCSSEKERLFSEDQVSAALTCYASTNNLITTSQQSSSDVFIRLDNLLATSLWGKKEGPEEGSELLQAVLFQRLLSKLQRWHRILRPSTATPPLLHSGNGGDTSTSNTTVLEVIRKGSVRPLSIIAEKRRGRNVTAISHVETFGWSADEIERDYQRRFKTACSVSKLPGKQESDYEILMQGDLLVKVERYLKEVEGIDGKFILINNKLSGKKKG
jgi:translation initiation factor 2D